MIAPVVGEIVAEGGNGNDAVFGGLAGIGGIEGEVVHTGELIVRSIGIEERGKAELVAGFTIDELVDGVGADGPGVAQDPGFIAHDDLMGDGVAGKPNGGGNYGNGAGIVNVVGLSEIVEIETSEEFVFAGEIVINASGVSIFGKRRRSIETEAAGVDAITSG